MNKLNLKGFCFAAALSMAVMPVLTHAEDADAPISAEDAEFAAILAELDAALTSGDDAAVSAVIANIVKANPALASKVASYVAAKKPESVSVVIDAIASVAPEKFSEVLAAATTELAKNPKNEQLVAQLLTKTAPAAGGNQENTGNKDLQNKPKQTPKTETPEASGN